MSVGTLSLEFRNFRVNSVSRIFYKRPSIIHICNKLHSETLATTLVFNGQKISKLLPHFPLNPSTISKNSQLQSCRGRWKLQIHTEMIENGASNQREIEQEGAAFFTQIEVIGEAEFSMVAADGGSRAGLRNDGLWSTSRRLWWSQNGTLVWSLMGSHACVSCRSNVR